MQPVAAIRFGLFFLRDDVVVFGGLKVAQVIAIGIAIAGAAWLLTLRRRGVPTTFAIPRPRLIHSVAIGHLTKS